MTATMERALKRRRPPTKRDLNNLAGLRVALYCRVSLDKVGDEKSVDDQEAEGLRWVDRHQAVLVDTYRDPNRSASRFATKQRENFNRLLEDIEAGKLDGGAVWFWEASRSQRRLDVFATLRDLCRNHGVLWIIRDRVQDPADADDMAMAGVQAIFSENESEKTAGRVRRGKASSASAGRPAGKVPYGYKRVYDPESGRSLRDVPNVYDGDGRPIEDSPAWIVREIFDRIAAGDSITGIRRDLNDRGTRTQQGHPWDNFKVRYIAMNPTYVGLRVYQGEILEGVPAFGDPLVDEATFWAVQRILSDPARMTTRLGARTGKYLLSSLGRCAECGGKLLWKKAPADNQRRQYKDIYYCKDRSCVGIYAEGLDEYVEGVIVGWLSDPDVVADLTGGDDSAAAKQARVDADRAGVELEEWRKLADRGEISAPSFARAEKGLLARIKEAERVAQAATLPPVLVGNIGPQAQAGWDALDLMGKRQIVQTVADIRVRRVGRGRTVPIRDRVAWTWLLGPQGGDAITDPE
jgi:DNA invertase Pin-like site-specific DNA recombinase